MFSFIQEIEGVEFVDALRTLASKAGIELKSFDPAVKDDKARLYEVCESAAKFFEKQFQSNTGKRALGYLKNRGVQDETIKEFRLGFAPNDWNALGTYLRDCGYSQVEIIDAGLAIKRTDGSGVYDRFRSRIMFPISDLNGQVVGFTGRIFESDETEAAKYINSPQTRIYDKSKVLYGLDKAKMEIKRADQCVLVEGNMDALMSYQAGVKNVVASSGTALTPNHLRLLQRYTTNLGFCFDTDQAGAMATRRGIGLAISQNLDIKVIQINDKECKDPADLINKNSAGWNQAVVEAKPVIDFYFEKAKNQLDLSSTSGKKSAIAILAPFLKRLTSQVEKNHWIRQLAFFLRAKEESIEADVAFAKDDLEAYDHEPVLASKTEVKNNITPDPLSETLLSLVIKDPALFRDRLADIDPEMLDPYTATAVKKLTVLRAGNIADLLKEFRENNQSYKLEFAYLKSQEFWKDSKEEDLKNEFNNLINKLEERHLRGRLEKIGFEIRAVDSKDKKLALASEANKILTRLGEIQKV